MNTVRPVSLTRYSFSWISFVIESRSFSVAYSFTCSSKLL